jgi:molybdopterin synthase catalytic subunit
MGATIVQVQEETFDAAAAASLLHLGRTDLGALVTFTGLCRDDGGDFAALEIEHYPGMAQEEINRVVDEVRARWPIDGVVVIHRFGVIRPGEPIVLVATTSQHRSEAFAAAEFLMDFLKTRAPFWKKIHKTAEAADDAASDWVAAKAQDDAAAAKWSR